MSLQLDGIDNNVVTLLSNQFGVSPIKKAERYSREDRKRILVDMPKVVAQYYKNMGGVDLMDNQTMWQLIRSHMRGKSGTFLYLCG